MQKMMVAMDGPISPIDDCRKDSGKSAEKQRKVGFSLESPHFFKSFCHRLMVD
jgi:hypothetical protein